MKTTLRHAAKLVTPPIVPAFVRWCQAFPTRGKLFDGNDGLFLDLIAKATAYAEYGCGTSTIWTANETSLKIMSVDTSADWLHHVKSSINRTNDITAVHVDLGPLGDWGRPVGYQHRSKFIDYVEGPWRADQSSDLVLIDGRFRMACFLTSLLRAKPGTTILFDDYIDRAHFQVAEEYVPSMQKNARQAAFIVPEQIDRSFIEAERDKFLYVME